MNRRPEILLPDDLAQREMGRRTRRGFLIGGVAAAAGFGGYEWIKNAPQDAGVSWPQREVLNLNGRIWHSYLSDARRVPTYSRQDVGFLKVNGTEGLKKPVGDDWNISLSYEDEDAIPLTLADVKSLPRTEMVTRLCCIEGWNVITQWAGVRFADFTRKFLPPGRTLTKYVYMTTPDEEYYVGLDVKSAVHPQTLLAYEMNGAPLTPPHGAPLRLVIPVKYGIKNIKRIGNIQFTNKRPGDFWADEGYDWFAGL